MTAKRIFKAPLFATLTAVGLVLGCLSAANAQSQPSDSGMAAGGGAFPGSFLVPGTNTSLKIGGFAKAQYIYDMSAPPANSPTLGASSPDLDIIQAIPLEGSAAHQLHGGFRINVRQSNFNFDTRTPTSYGELDTFVLVDFYGRENPSNIASFQDRSNPDAARLVYAYGSLGPLLAGQATSLWYDGDAMPESVDPSPTAGTMNILSNRQPQIRYTYATPNGFSFAGSIENPEGEVYSNTPFNATVPGLTCETVPASTSCTVVSSTFGQSTSSLGGVDRLPDFIVRARLDQGWGHIAITGIYRDLAFEAPGIARVQRNAYGAELSGHFNTYGKDVVRGLIMIGQGLGHYQSDFIEQGGLQVSALTGTPSVGIGRSGSANVSYTHWWTGDLRSTIDAGYAKLNSDLGIITSAAAQNALDKEHINAFANLIWSPVPQVDLGIEYDWGKRVTNAAAAGVGNFGYMNRLTAETVFKF